MIDQANLGGRPLHRHVIRCQDRLADGIILCQVSVGIHDQRKLLALKLLCLDTNNSRPTLCIGDQLLIVEHFNIYLYRSGHVIQLCQVNVGAKIGSMDLVSILCSHIKIYGYCIFSTQFIGSSCLGQHLFIHDLKRNFLASGHFRI